MLVILLALALVAQGIERLPPEQKAVGSNPIEGTKHKGSRSTHCETLYRTQALAHRGPNRPAKGIVGNRNHHNSWSVVLALPRSQKATP